MCISASSPDCGAREGGRWSSSLHSAHIGQIVAVHYPWHRFHGLSVCVVQLEQRASGQSVRVEAPSGEVALVPSWMLDAVVCAGMELSEPEISLTALAELHRLLIDTGVALNSREAANLSREETDDDRLASCSTIPTPDRTGARITGASGPEPVRAHDRVGIADDLPDSPSLVLAVYEVALGA